jgi:ribosomal-protein-alanine N-acetyltransferase
MKKSSKGDSVSELVIRKGSKKDIKGMAMIEDMSFSNAWTEEMIMRDVEENKKFSTYIVAELGDEIVGYIGFWSIVDECQINTIAVSPFFRRQRIGTILLNTALRATEDVGIKTWTLELRTGNLAAKGLYESMGFMEEAVRKDYYSNPVEDAILMRRNI